MLHLPLQVPLGQVPALKLQGCNGVSLHHKNQPFRGSQSKVGGLVQMIFILVARHVFSAFAVIILGDL